MQSQSGQTASANQLRLKNMKRNLSQSNLSQSELKPQLVVLLEKLMEKQGKCSNLINDWQVSSTMSAT